MAVPMPTLKRPNPIIWRCGRLAILRKEYVLKPGWSHLFWQFWWRKPLSIIESADIISMRR